MVPLKASYQRHLAESHAAPSPVALEVKSRRRGPLQQGSVDVGGVHSRGLERAEVGLGGGCDGTRKRW
jgi:hypothetical protein